jgi:hypothetical protein
MYSYAQCTMQERSVCCRDVPCLAHMEQGPGPLHPQHLPPSLSAWVMGTQSTNSLQQGWTWTVEWTLASSPTRNLWLWKMCVRYCSLFPSSNTVFWNVYQVIICTVLIVVIFLGLINHTTWNKRNSPSAFIIFSWVGLKQLWIWVSKKGQISNGLVTLKKENI